MTAKPKARIPKRAGMIDGREMTVLALAENRHPDSKCAGTVAMVTRDKVAAQTAISWLMTDLTWLKEGEYHKRYIVQGNILTFQRNQCINDMEGDWILFIDSDMVWQPQAMKVLIETRDKFDLDIVSGLCFQRSDPYQPTLYKEAKRASLPGVDANWSGYTFMERWDEDAAMEVDATGMAFCLIHKRVFDRILEHKVGESFGTFEQRKGQVPAPFFRWEGEFGEDFLFCREAKESGSKVFVDTSVKIGHIGDQVITEETFLREIAFRDPDAEEFRAGVLEGIGEKVMTRREAMEKLGFKE
jgi:glycosyltransferase involved in cell wall biosynthesis